MLSFSPTYQSLPHSGYAHIYFVLQNSDIFWTALSHFIRKYFQQLIKNEQTLFYFKVCSQIFYIISTYIVLKCILPNYVFELLLRVNIKAQLKIKIIGYMSDSFEHDKAKWNRRYKTQNSLNNGKICLINEKKYPEVNWR